MNNEIVNPSKGKELRDLARSNPEKAYRYIEENKQLWIQIATKDPFDSADALEEFEPIEAGKLITELPTLTAVKIFESLRPRAIIEIVESLDDKDVEEIFKQMDTEDVVDVLERSTDDETDEILEILDKSTKLNIDRRLSYPEDSVGRQMSEEVAKISTGLTVKDALKELKLLHNNVEDLIYVYSVDKENRLTGVISFREIVFANEDDLIKNVMIQDPVFVNPSSDQEEAAGLIRQYELLALPVIDKDNKLIGQITINSALDVIQTEIAEDFSQSFGAGAEETIFTPIQKSIRSRLPWIAINMVLAFIVSFLIFQFEETITSNVLLAALMPVVALIGGSSGAQSLAIVIRALARNDVSEARVLDVIGKQTLIGIINGILVGTFSFLILSFVGLGDFSLALGSAVFTNIFIGNFFGSSIPLILKKLGFDPALASNIFLTLVTDIAGFGGFLAIALLLL
ncbi:magnesium transporter [Acidimicrobiaceae bacterium]|nr:magnesium transporter [Acidimicrobiaceae bacterium]